MDTPRNLKTSIGEGDLVEFTLSNSEQQFLEKISRLLKDFNGIEDSLVSSGRITIRALDVVPHLSRILNYIEDAGAQVENMSLRNTTLEDVFINLTGRALRD